MKFLIDECLSPELAKLARERGFPESSHVRWLGLAGAKDHMVTRRAVASRSTCSTTFRRSPPPPRHHWGWSRRFAFLRTARRLNPEKAITAGARTGRRAAMCSSRTTRPTFAASIAARSCMSGWSPSTPPLA
ncbi:DUF5615 family PIN-like protein [Mesorhizobium sp. M0115]|uniref:DUF5615 family PIN-like protein n=1 Tax=Mesorhizobium sp. M0115 TaxID=2956883 RepID=UPI0033374A11